MDYDTIDLQDFEDVDQILDNLQAYGSSEPTFTRSDTSAEWIGPARLTQADAAIKFLRHCLKFMKTVSERAGTTNRQPDTKCERLLFINEILGRHIYPSDVTDTYITLLWYRYYDALIVDHSAATSVKAAVQPMSRPEFFTYIEVALNLAGLTRRDMRLKTEPRGKIACSAVRIITPYVIFEGSAFHAILIEGENFDFHLDYLDWILLLEKSCAAGEVIKRGFGDTAIPGTKGAIIFGHGNVDRPTRSFLNRIYQKAGRIIPTAGAFDADYGGAVIEKSWRKPLRDRTDTHRWNDSDYDRLVTRIAIDPAAIHNSLGRKYRENMPPLPSTHVSKLETFRKGLNSATTKTVDWMISNKKTASLTIVETATYAKAANGGTLLSLSDYLAVELNKWWKNLPAGVKKRGSRG